MQEDYLMTERQQGTNTRSLLLLISCIDMYDQYNVMCDVYIHKFIFAFIYFLYNFPIQTSNEKVLTKKANFNCREKDKNKCMTSYAMHLHP